jgi:hypothetical protein
MRDPRPLFIVTPYRDAAIAELFGAALPGWARVLTCPEDLGALETGDAVLGWRLRRMTALDEAFLTARARLHPLGLPVERLSGFLAWRRARGLAPLPVLEGVDGVPGGCVVSAGPAAKPDRASGLMAGSAGERSEHRREDQA